VLRPGGIAAVTVPAWLPERVCWRLSDDYHNVPGGHVRIFTLRELEIKLTAAGLDVGGHHRAHALHSPYWWLKCAVGVHRDQHPLAQAYHRLLVWDIMKRPKLTQVADRALNPVLGKSLVVYATKPAASPVTRELERPGNATTVCRSGGSAKPARADGKGAPGGEAPRSGGPGVTPRDKTGEVYAGA
jgi:hypothetical protein